MYGRRGKDNPNYGQHRSEDFCRKTSERMKQNNYMTGRFGDKNPRAKRVVRLSDNKVYSCGKEAAAENNIVYSTFKQKCQRGDGFAYYSEMI